MTDKIIALVDGSIYLTSVCENAAWISGRTGASVELLHVLGRRETATSDLSGSIGLGARSELLAELSALDEQRTKLAQRRGRAIVEGAEAALRAAGVAPSRSGCATATSLKPSRRRKQRPASSSSASGARPPTSPSSISVPTWSASRVRRGSRSSSRPEPSARSPGCW